MAQYGISAYQAAYYGPPTTSSLLASNFVVTPVPPVGSSTLAAYNTLYLSWQNPGSSSWYRMRLVRSEYGFPATQDDGIVLFDLNAGPAGTHTDSAITAWVDTGLKAPKFYYYSLFVSTKVSQTTQWTRAADGIGQSVADHGYGNYLLQRLPSAYSSPQGTVDEEPYPGTSLSRFLDIFGADISRVRDYLDHLNYVEDPDNVLGLLLPPMLTQFGYTYEPAVGMRRNRVLAENAIYVNSMKGTTPGLTTLSQAVTGWKTSQLHIINLMLDENDASFEQSIGNWAVTSGTATLSQNTTVGGYSNGAGNGVVGCLQVTSGGTAAINISPTSPPQTQYGNASLPYNYGPYGGVNSVVQCSIPVTTGTTYTCSARFRSAATSRQPTINVQWYDKTGTLLSTTTGAAGTASTTTDWTGTASVTGAAPANAVYALPVIVYGTIANGEVQYVDAVQFEAAGSASTYSPARQIRLMLAADRVNEAINAGFDADVSNWTGTNCTLTWDSGTTFNGGVGAGKATVTTKGTAASARTTFNCDASKAMMFAAEVQPQVSGDEFYIQVDWYTAGAALISTITSPAVAANSGAWTRLVLTGTSPSNASNGRVYVVSKFGTCTAFWIDDVLAEQGIPNNTSQYGSGGFGSGVYDQTVPAYFDTYLNSGDAKWEGTTNASRLHLYMNYGPRNSRLTDLISKAVPLGFSYSLNYAQPRGTS